MLERDHTGKRFSCHSTLLYALRCSHQRRAYVLTTLYQHSLSAEEMGVAVFHAIIPTRFLALTAHLVLNIMLYWSRVSGGQLEL